MASKTSFLTDLASDLYDRHRQGISRLTFIFPNEWVGKVFKQCLAAHLPPNTPPPTVLSLETWIQQLSPLGQAQSLLLTHMLYQTFQSLRPREESFEQFYFWGSLLLEDFDVIDKYLADAIHLFTDLSKHKELGLSYDYLTEAQRAAIQSFWKNFAQRLSTHQQGFLDLWKLLPQVYQHFNKRLHAQGIGYQGLCHRAAYEALLRGTAPVQHHQLVFAGFNALTPVEEKIMVWHQENLSASFFWDVDAYYMENTQQEAGFFLRKHREKTYFQASFSLPFPKRIAANNQEVHITEVASEVSQVQVVSAQLKTLIKTQGASFVPEKTAIVVANEALRLPMLHALPLGDIPISTHVGYPLRDTAIYRLLEYLLAMQVAVATQEPAIGYFATRHVLAILKHPHVMGCNPPQVEATINSLQVSKRSYVTRQDLVGGHALYANIFKMIGPTGHLIPYLIEVLESIEVHAPVEMLRPMEKMALQQLLQQLGRLQELLATSSPKHEVLLQLLRQLVQSLQLPLGDQILNGVQVLDVSAAQNLDFDHVFIVGMNEGHFPAQAGLASFIPHSLRKGYGLPTADQHQAALYAYHFYRLLQRARQVYITYSTQTTSDGQGEMSRYLLQLLYESKLHLKKSAVTHPIHLNRVQPIVITKKGDVLQRLKRFLLQPDGTAQHLTPSSLNTYLDCRLRFYFQYLAQLKAPGPQQQAATHAVVFGNALHKVMENLYAPLMAKKKNKLIQSQDLESLQNRVPAVVQGVFARTLQLHQLAVLPGDHAIAQAIMVKLVNKILALDQIHTPFALIGLEMGRQVPLYFDFYLNPTTGVRLQGVIDRVDWKAGVFRVLDYKTGIAETKIKSIASLFDRTITRRNKIAFQVLFYAWLFYHKGMDYVTFPVSQEKVSAMPGLFNTRQIFNTHFDPRFFFSQAGNSADKPIEDIAKHQSEWEEGLQAMLTELLDPAVPFMQTDDDTRCTLCPYKGICERHS